ncbi:MAG TPA: hypothetical protein EYH05_03535 [Anaerolineae bacterium]|nr:hypothetical protein [Anaerolineae bacterium]
MFSWPDYGDDPTIWQIVGNTAVSYYNTLIVSFNGQGENMSRSIIVLLGLLILVIVVYLLKQQEPSIVRPKWNA